MRIRPLLALGIIAGAPALRAQAPTSPLQVAPAPTTSGPAALRAEQRDDPSRAPGRRAGEGDGPYRRLIIRGATMHAAETLFKPAGKEIEFGVVRPGLLADLAIVDQNPVENLKVLYANGALKLDDATGKAERVGGVRWTIKDGIVYDARKLAADVARMVEEQRRTRPPTANVQPELPR